MQEKELLRKLGEETLYSAKGHFKSCDLRRQLITYTIWLCAVLNVLSIIGINPTTDKLLAAVGLLGTIALLIWNEGEGKNYRAKHKQAAETYLALHKEIRSCYFLSDCGKEQVETLSKKVSEFDKSEKPDIPGFARLWAKQVIERKNSETDNWFLIK
ncbi:MAG: hypothetical protein BGO54_07805 [Sphingobacteriales bacterium 46-32]|nr:MAG: hypothetical protein BGO54_07805 [Sphingobacteriales bacterium 46-32]